MIDKLHSISRLTIAALIATGLIAAFGLLYMGPYTMQNNNCGLMGCTNFRQRGLPLGFMTYTSPDCIEACTERYMHTDQIRIDGTYLAIDLAVWLAPIYLLIWLKLRGSRALRLASPLVSLAIVVGLSVSVGLMRLLIPGYESSVGDLGIGVAFWLLLTMLLSLISHGIFQRRSSPKWQAGLALGAISVLVIFSLAAFMYDNYINTSVLGI